MDKEQIKMSFDQLVIN